MNKWNNKFRYQVASFWLFILRSFTFLVFQIPNWIWVSLSLQSSGYQSPSSSGKATETGSWPVIPTQGVEKYLSGMLWLRKCLCIAGLAFLYQVILSNRLEFVTEIISFQSIVTGQFSMTAWSDAYLVIYSTSTGIAVYEHSTRDTDRRLLFLYILYCVSRLLWWVEHLSKKL